MLNVLLYWLVIIPISRAPFWLLYLWSRFFYFVLVYVVPYRKKVVIKNLQNSFPSKDTKEIIAIYKRFAKHFADLIMETVKTFTISKKQILKRFVVENPELVEAYYEKGQSVILTCGHYNNWEVAAVASAQVFNHKILGVYMPLKNQFWDKTLQKTRSRFGVHLVSVKKVKEVMQNQTPEEPSALCLIADQSPSNPYRCYWTTFLNQETGVLFGPEHYAKTYDLPILYAKISKQKRGHYSVRFQVISDTPKETAYGEISEKFIRNLEQDIVADPEYWLWTHKRWKKKKPADFDEKLRSNNENY